MKKGKIYSILGNALFQSMAIYIILAVLLLPFFKYQINPDGISYIGIAQKYLIGDFSNAVCGSWSPLISWLLVPFLYIGLKPLLAFKILVLIIGAVTIFQSYRLIKIMNIGGFIQNISLITIAVVILFFAFRVITPDLLLVCIVLMLINSLIDNSYSRGWRGGLIAGLFGGLIFLTKTYGFPYFLACFTVVSIIYYFREDIKKFRIRILKNYLIGMLVFIIISFVWIGLLYNKYGDITIGTAASYNTAVYGKESSGHPSNQSEVHHPFFDKLLAPANETAISAWEDFSYVEVEDWSLFESFSTIKHIFINVLKNTYKSAGILQYFSFLSISLLIITFLFLLEKGKSMFMDNIFILLVFIVMLFPGYLMLYLEDRYIWLANILLIIISAKLISYFFKHFTLKKITQIIIVLIVSASFLINPINALYKNRNTGEEIVRLTEKIYDLNIQGKIASSGNWSSSLKLSFYNDWHYYGEFFVSEELALVNELESYDIDYYITWAPFEDKLVYLEDFEEITDGKIDELRIFRIK